MGDDVVVSLEDPVREPVVAHELPDVLDGVQLWRARWQGQERDVPGHDERAGEMPACPVEDEKRVASVATAPLISSRCSCIASVSQNGMTMPAPRSPRRCRPRRCAGRVLPAVGCRAGPTSG